VNERSSSGSTRFQGVTTMETTIAGLDREPLTCGNCGICGSSAVTTDEVDAPEVARLLLAECLRCEHRWTLGLSALSMVRTCVRPVAAKTISEREVASAA
jgi:hypothetical protein